MMGVRGAVAGRSSRIPAIAYPDLSIHLSLAAPHGCRNHSSLSEQEANT